MKKIIDSLFASYFILTFIAPEGNLNSSPIDELGNWCPKGWLGTSATQG